MRRALLLTVFVCVVGLALAAPPRADAWQPSVPGVTWNGTVSYQINQAGSPDIGGFSTTETEVNRAMNDWTLVSCTSLQNLYGGSTSRSPESRGDGNNVIGWVESGWRYGGGAIGVTSTSRGRSFYVEADMEMNGVNYSWVTGSGSPGMPNTYSIALHEGGHFYGLGHTNVPGSSMWPSYSGGIVGLGPDDENGICALYPGAGSDCTTTGCPSGQECVSGTCEFVMGDGTVCAPCMESSDCGGPGDLCINYGVGGFCGRNCGSDADCEGADRCAALQGGGRQCVRFDGGTPSCDAAMAGCTTSTDCPTGQICQAGTCMMGNPGAGLGEACTANEDCSSGLCFDGACTQTCDFATPATSCPGGFYCDADPSSCDTGFCRSGGAGAGVLGAPCAGDTDCASLFCEAGACSQPCAPDGALSCPDGFACQIGALPCRGSCQQSGALGDQCEDNLQCTSGICATLGELSFCTEFCDDAMNPCPDRFSCTSAGASSVCVPNGGGLGADCESNDDCVSGICAVEAGQQYCTRICDATTPCPAGTFTCTPTTDPNTSVCRPNAEPVDDGGCGCRVAGSDRSDPLTFGGLLMLGLLLVWRRRR